MTDEIEIPEGFTRWDGETDSPIKVEVIDAGGRRRVTYYDRVDWEVCGDEDDIIGYRIVTDA